MTKNLPAMVEQRANNISTYVLQLHLRDSKELPLSTRQVLENMGINNISKVKQ